MNDRRTGFTESCTQNTAVIANQLCFSLLTTLADVFVKRAVILTKFIRDLLILRLHLTIIHNLLSRPYFFYIRINHKVDGPPEHVLDWMHRRAMSTFIEEVFWDLTPEFRSLILHQLLLLFQWHRQKFLSLTFDAWLANHPETASHWDRLHRHDILTLNAGEVKDCGLTIWCNFR